MSRFCSLAVALLMAIVILPAYAGDEGLYPDAPPPGSAFVRFLNADSRAAAIEVQGKSYGAVQQGQLSRYIFVPNGAAELKFGPDVVSKEVTEGRRYSIVLARGKATVLEEPAEQSPLKAEIMLINASSRPAVALKTADGKTDIIEPVATGKLGVRAVNAVKVPFALYAEGRKIEEIAARDLQRGGSYAVVVYDGAGGKAVVSFNEKTGK